MTAVFPQAPLGTAVELYLGPSLGWTDVSTLVYQRDPITITRGRPDESSQVTPSSCALTLNNGDNRFSINNPTGPYYGLLGRNTPVRTSVPAALLPSPFNTTYLRLEDDAVSYASCPDATRLDISGSLEMRIDFQPTTYAPCVLAAKYTGGGCWAWLLDGDGTVVFVWVITGGSTFWSATSTAPIPVATRQALRVTLSVATGTVTFYTAASIDGTYAQLGRTVSPTGGAATTVNTGASPLQVGANVSWATEGYNGVQGSVREYRLYNGIGGTVVADAVFTAQTAGATSWTDAPGNSWSVSGTAVLSNRSYRYYGELAQTPKATDPTATDVYSQATAAGVLRRLGQAQNPVNSPMYRALVRETGASAPLAYWPCEDGTQATHLANGIPGGSALQISGTPQLASDSSILSSAPLPVLDGSIWRAPIPQGGTWVSNVMQLCIVFPSSASTETDQEVIASIYGNGTVHGLDLRYGVAGTGSINLQGYDINANVLFNSGAITPPENVTGNPMFVAFGMVNTGTQIQWQLVLHQPDTIGVANVSGVVAGVTIGAITNVMVNTHATCQQLAVGHVAVYNSWGAFTSLVSPFNAWVGETAGERVLRLCTEESVACRIVGPPHLSVPMGPQSIETIPQLLQECETTDRGQLFEPRSCLGVGYRTLYSMYNQAPRTSVNYAGAQLGRAFASTADDQLTINDVTVTNQDGSSARQVLTSGAMSIQAPPGGVGRVDTDIQVNSQSDDDLPHIAQWILNASTDAHDRFPTIPFNLARAQTPFSVATLDIGDLAAITNPPQWLQPDEIDQLCFGFTETLGPFATWQIDVSGVPAYPYTVAICAPATSAAPAFTGAGYAMHVDTDGTTLTSAVSSTATGLSFTSMAAYPPWTSSPADYPFDVNVSGERITVVGPGTCLGTDPFLAQGTAQYSAGDATIAMSSAVGAPYPATGYGTSAILVTPVGSPDTFAQVLGKVATASTSTSYTVWAWVYATAARSYTLFANWLLSGVQVSFGDATPVSVPAGVWTLISGTITSPSSGINQLTLGVNDTNTPTTAQTYYVWGLNGAKTSTITAASPQLMTGQRSVNGVVKAQASGANLTLWYRPIIGQLTGT